MKVLVVDDSPTMRRMVKNVLVQLGHTDVLEAEDGIQALQLLEMHAVDLLIIDWNMPGINGIEVVRRLRQKSRYQSLPVIMISIRDNRDDVLQAAQAQVSGYLLKPFSPTVLQKKIEQVLAAHKAETN
ncbi:MAG: response regulator [Calditrichaeota bacterium]|nr:MAG: response regulator [Calditrichota bacterium]